MGIRVCVLSLILTFASSTMLGARPVSYTSGSTMMYFSDNLKESVYYHYSPSYKYSLGLEWLKDKVQNENYAYLRYTHLLNRKNTQNSQRNLYFQSGISSEGIDRNFIGMHGDWETRRLFTGFGLKHVQADVKDYTKKYIQLGIAPYLGDYGDLHTWFLIKTKTNSLTNEWNSYPVLKLFKGNFMVELGYDENDEWDAHLMYRF